MKRIFLLVQILYSTTNLIAQNDVVEVIFNKGKFDKKIPYDKPMKLKIWEEYELNDTTSYKLRGVTLKITNSKGMTIPYTAKKGSTTFYEINVNTETYYPGSEYTFDFTLMSEPNGDTLKKFDRYITEYLNDPENRIIEKSQLDELTKHLINKVEKSGLEFKGDIKNLNTELDNILADYNRNAILSRELIIYKLKIERNLDSILARPNVSDSLKASAIVLQEKINKNLISDDLEIDTIDHHEDSDEIKEFRNDINTALEGLLETYNYQKLKNSPELINQLAKVLIENFVQNIFVKISLNKVEQKTESSNNKTGLRVGIGGIYYSNHQNENSKKTERVFGAYLSTQIRFYPWPVDKTINDPYKEFWWKFSINVGAMIGTNKYYGTNLQSSTMGIMPTASIGFDLTKSLGMEFGFVGFEFPQIVGIPDVQNSVFLVRPVFGITYDLNILEKIKQ